MALHIRFERRVLASFVLAVVVVAGLGLATWQVAGNSRDAAAWVEHTHEVITSLAEARADSLQVELSTQGYRLSGDPARLIERDAAIAQREAVLDRLRRLTIDNPRQQERWQALRAVIDERLAISRRTEMLRRTQGAEAASAYIARAPLQETRERMHRVLQEMDADERRLLDERSAELARARDATGLGGLAVTLALAGLLAGTYTLVRRQLRETEAARETVRAQNEMLEQRVRERTLQLSESEEHLRSVTGNVPALIAYVDARQRYVYVNGQYGDRFAAGMGDISGRTVREVLGEERYAVAAPLIAAVLQGQAQTYGWQPFPGMWEMVNYVPRRDACGGVVGYYVLGSDVTAMKRTEAALRESDEKLRLFIYYAPSAIAMFDREMRYLACSRRWLTDYGLADADVVGRSHYEVFPEISEHWKALHRRCLAGAVEMADEDPFPRADGSLDWVRWEMHPWYVGDGSVGGIVLFSEVITERKQAQARIEALNEELAGRVHDLERVSRALRTLSAGNRAMLHGTDEQDLLEGMCRAIVDAGGYRMATVWYAERDEGRSLRPMAEAGYPGGIARLAELKGTWADDERGRGSVAAAVRSGRTQLVADIASDPGYAPWRPNLPDCASVVACPLRVDGEVIGALSMYACEPDAFSADEVKLLTESADDLAFGIATLRARVHQQEVRDAMQRLLRFDALTGLPNQLQFGDLLSGALDAGRLARQSFAVLQINIERLGEINDALGFREGDRLLETFGNRLRGAGPGGAVVARLRGDEFAILVPDCNAAGAMALVRRLKMSLAEPFLVGDIPLDVAATIGVAIAPEHGTTPHDLFRSMDMAVRQAKRGGLAHAVFDPAVHRDQPRRLTMAGELRRAIERGELVLHLQPKVDMATGRVCGAEGLVRWLHPGRGLIAPAEFIGIAEHTGLIKPLTERVIELGLSTTRAWLDRGRPLPVAVNLSTRNLKDDDLIENIRRALASHAVAASLLELEITESTLMDDADLALRALHALCDEGIRLSIDDFGTGYSSLSYLQKLPVEYIKIDQSFVRDMAVNKDSLSIVRSTIDLVHDLGRKVVAEGVETREHWNQLAALGCDIAQGFFIARPMPAEEFQAWLQRFDPAAAALTRG